MHMYNYNITELFKGIKIYMEFCDIIVQLQGHSRLK